MDKPAFALLDNIVRDVAYAGRSFRRAPLVALTIVTTVGLGLGLVAVVFTLLNLMVFRADDVRNPHELFAVVRQRSVNAEPESFTRAHYDTLVRETSVFADTFASTPEIDAWIDGQRMEGPLVTGNFFQLLGVSAARGRTLTRSDDEPGSPPAIVLSHRAWSRYFASDPAVLSRAVLLNGSRVHVVGVMPESFRGLTVFPPDYWAPLSLIDRFRRAQQGREDAVGVGIVGRLRPGVSRGQALAQLIAWDAQHAAERSIERPVTNLTLEPRQGTVPLSADVLALFTPLFFAFGLILLIGCANIANLLLARAVARQREIGIRLAMGAARRRIIGQLLTESLVLSLVSAVLAFGISRLVLEAALYAITSTWSSGFGDIRVAVPPADWRLALFLVAGAIVSTVFFALAPALQATRLELVRAMRGEVVRDARPGRARSALVALQVTGSALLLICAAVFLRSAWALAAVDPGFRTTDTVNVTVLNEQRRGAILDVVKGEPSVASVAASWPAVLGGRPGIAEGASGTSAVTYQFVSPEYFGVLGIDLVRGRSFAQTERSASAAAAVVSESVARQLWPGADVLGRVLRLEPDASPPSGGGGKSQPGDTDNPRLLSRSFIVVGVARDVAGFRVGGQGMTGAGVYVPIGTEAAGTSLTLRARGDAERARHALVDRLAAIDPNMAEVTTLRTFARLATYLLGIPFWLTLVLGTLALLLTLSGLFSVLSYLVEQRTREIGVRMALGATRRHIAALVLVQSARPVAVGLFLGASLTAALGAALLATPAAELIGSSVRLFDPLAYAASLLCIVTSCASAALIPAVRAARVDPIAALRQD
jgi:predicted permease